MKIAIRHNFPEVLAAIDQLGLQTRGAVREALNRTAEWAATDMRRELAKTFDRPVPYTQRSLKVYYATTANLEAALWFRQRRQDADKQWAAAQIQGGRREIKPMELRLQRIGVLPRGWLVVPGSAMPLDAYGNMSAGEVSRILNVLGAYTESGYNKANDKTRKRLRKGNAKKGHYGFEYWVNPAGTQRQRHLAPGVYRRVYTGFGQALKPMLIFVSGAKYRPLLQFEAAVNKTTARRFPEEFNKAMRSLLATGSASAFRRRGQL